MNSLRLAHVGDLHIGAGYIHGNDVPGGVNSRLEDFRDAWVRSCRQMVEDCVDLVLIAGDGFRDNHPSPTEQAALRLGLDILCDTEIPVVAVTGNHDDPRGTGRTDALKIFNRPRDGVMVASQPQIITPIEDVQIACLPTPSRAWLDAKHEGFTKLSTDEQIRVEADLSLQAIHGLSAEASLAGGISIFLAHGTIAGSTFGAQNSMDFLRGVVLPLPELIGLPFQYQAWGHVHKAQTLATRIRYCGSIERVTFAEAEDDKGWWLVDLTDGDCSVEWRSSSPRPFLDIELTAPTNWDDELHDMHLDVARAIVRVRYSAIPEIDKTLDKAGIREALKLAGAVKVYGPENTYRPVATERTEGLTEDTSPWLGYTKWRDLQGLSAPQCARLDALVKPALQEVAL